MSTGLLIIVFAFIFGVAIVWHFVTLNYVLPKVALDVCLHGPELEDRLEHAIYLKSNINGELCLFTDIRVSNIAIEQTFKNVRLNNGREFSLSRDEHLDSDLWDILYHINCSLSGDRFLLGRNIFKIDEPSREKLTWDDYDR
mgnify:CR=1 FL=1